VEGDSTFTAMFWSTGLGDEGVGGKEFSLVGDMLESERA
jgi:hypothetical protein